MELNEVDTRSKEGRLLMGLLACASSKWPDYTPMEILDIAEGCAERMFSKSAPAKECKIAE